MAQRPLSRAQLVEAVHAYKDAGGIAVKAAMSLGIPETTFRNRMRAARQAGLEIPTFGIIPPHNDNVVNPRQATRRAGNRVARTCPSCGGEKHQQAAVCMACHMKRTHGQEVEPAPPPEPQAELVESTETHDDSMHIVKNVSRRVQTLADLVEVCQIDLEEWDIERWLCNKWEMASKTITRDGNVAVTGSPVVTELFQVKVWLKRRSQASKNADTLRQWIIEDIRAEVALEPPRARPARSHEGGWLFEFSPFDLHAGKYTWRDETVTDYDADIAEDLFNSALDFLLEKAMRMCDGRIEQILCVYGNDVSHSDNKRGTTTAGTPLDMDTRFIRVFRKILAMHRRSTDILRGVAPVHISIVPGNHDELTSVMLGEVMSERYSRDPHITVDNGPKFRKYYEYGTNLWGFTHGNVEKITELPIAMAREVPEAWARCQSREWHIGHLHIGEKWTLRHPSFLEQDLISDKGVRIRRLNSLSGHDAWHTQHAYMDRRCSDAFVFHKTAGFTADISFNLDHFTGKPLLTDDQ